MEIVMEGFSPFKTVDKLCEGDTFMLNGEVLACVCTDDLIVVQCYNFNTEQIEAFVNAEELQQTVQLVKCKLVVTPMEKEEKNRMCWLPF